jgi:short-subunit dehydrogenase
VTSVLQGRRALVTGASSGIGAAVVHALVGGGVRVVAAGREKDALARLDGVEATVAGDLTEAGQAAALVEAAAQALGGLDVVVANAGAGWAGPFASMTADEIDGLIDLNFRANAQLARAALPWLTVGPPVGRLVFVGSVAGLVPVPGEALYSATKFALAGLAGALRSETASEGVTVSLVSPGVVDTAFFARRNRPYTRRRPRPIPAARVAAVVVDAIATGRAEAVVPRWLAFPARLRGAAPGVYRVLSDRFGPAG